MRGATAKKLRREAFGDQSSRVRSYGVMKHKIYKTRKDKDGKNEMYFVDKDTVVCTGPRAVYKKLKKGR
jgi:hypothetical protein